MKKTITILLLSMTAPGIHKAEGQTVNYPYTFSYSTEPYTYLADDATEILGSTGWEDTIVAFSLPIDFKYQGVAVTQWHADSYGGLYPNGMDLDLESPFIAGLSADYEDQGGASIRYQITGTTAGSRIAKVEYRHLGFYNGTPSDTANFQIWLYEGSDNIEFHAGPNHVSDSLLDFTHGNSPLVVGLIYDQGMSDTVLVQGIRLHNGVHTDTVISVDPDNADLETLLALIYGNTYPVENSVFAFSPLADTTTAIAKLPSQLSGLYPNPVKDKLTIQLKAQPLEDALITIYSLSGKKLLTQQVKSITTEVDMAALTKGIYLLTYKTGNRREAFRVIKK